MNSGSPLEVPRTLSPHLSQPVGLDFDQTRWKRVLESIRKEVNEYTFRAWYEPLQFQGLDQDVLVVQGPDNFFVDWFTENCIEPLQRAIWEEAPNLAGVRIDAAPEPPTSAEPEPAPPAPPVTRVPASGRSRRNLISPEQAGLRPQYTFANFVVGENNHLASAAAQAVGDRLAQVYNPLYIHSPSGLGKTHLMQAIGNHVLQRDPTLTVHYVSSENFMNELIQAIRNGSTMDFKNRYRTVDLLLIDDIQFIAGRETTQQEFFHTFNALYDANKQIVVSSDVSPAEISALEERLRSRFQWGLITDIQSPNFEERVAILKKKVERQEIILPEDVIICMAENIQSNIRELEGALVRLLAFSSLTGHDITLDMATEVLRNLLKSRVPRAQLSLADIMRAASEYYGISTDALQSKVRTKQVAHARQMAMYICRENTQASLNQIGLRFGKRDHTTVHHGWQKIGGLVKSDGDVHREHEEIMQRLRSRR
ncbi:chromosomal replication initiator protein DnaA [bacterium]|nr:MAG: chromosomal replication initiator protein DnaA [bacterium]